MNCFVHPAEPAIGVCTVCGKAICTHCVGRHSPRLLCASCASGHGFLGFEYRSKTTVRGWPLVHVCSGVDPATMRPRVAKGVIAIGNVAVGGIAFGGVALGLVSIGGLAVGVLGAIGGLAAGLGISMGGVAIGSIAIGGLALGWKIAVGGGAFGPAVIEAGHCDPSAKDFLVRWFGNGVLPPECLH